MLSRPETPWVAPFNTSNNSITLLTSSSTKSDNSKFLIFFKDNKYSILLRRVAFPRGVRVHDGIAEKTNSSGAFNSSTSVNISRTLVQKCRAASGFLGCKENNAPRQRLSSSSDMTPISSWILVCLRLLASIKSTSSSGVSLRCSAYNALKRPTVFAASRSDRSAKKFSCGDASSALVVRVSSFSYAVVTRITDCRY